MSLKGERFQIVKHVITFLVSSVPFEFNLAPLHHAVESAPALVGVHVHDALAAIHSKGTVAQDPSAIVRLFRST